MEHEDLDLKIKQKARSTRLYRLVIGLVSICLIAICLIFYWYRSATDGIYDYKAKRDRQVILDIFDKDWYWLVAGDRNSFSPEHMIDTNSPNRYNADLQGQEKIKVFLVNGQPAGFISYYKKKAYQGQIHIIQVLPEYRGRGYAKLLMRSAINDLFSDPAISLIKLVTRTNNPAAIKLYLGLGFTEEIRDEALVDFTLKRENYIK